MMNFLIKIVAFIMMTALPLVAAQKSDKEQKLEVDSQKTRNISLLRAVKAGQLNYVKDLLSQKADINCMNKHGYTPLKIAASKNHQEVLALLLAAGADDTLANFHWLYDQDSMLIKSQKQNLIKTYENYLKDVRHQICQSNTGLPDVVVNIIMDKMWITEVDRALGFAVLNEESGKIKNLLRLGADPNFCGYRGPALLIAGCRKDGLEIMRLLLDARANPNLEKFAR